MIYAGILRHRKMPDDARKAYYIWQEQRARCRNPKHPMLYRYGARGIKVEYSSREFIGWYLEELQKNQFKRPDVGRLDHDGNYCFSNVRIEEHSENVSERNDRMGNPTPKMILLVYDRTMRLIDRVEGGGRVAAKKYGTNQTSVRRCCVGMIRATKKGFTFRYEGKVA